MTTPPSPRERHDFLLLHTQPSARTILEAFATEDGVLEYGSYRNLVDKASTLLPDLPLLMEKLSPDLVAARVCMFLDGQQVGDDQTDVELGGLLDTD